MTRSRTTARAPGAAGPRPAPAAAPKGRAAPAPASPALQAAPALSPLAGVQRKLAVGRAGDAYEREADAVADRVTAGQPAPSISAIPAAGLPGAQRKTGMEEEETGDTAQAKAEWQTTRLGKID